MTMPAAPVVDRSVNRLRELSAIFGSALREYGVELAERTPPIGFWQPGLARKPLGARPHLVQPVSQDAVD